MRKRILLIAMVMMNCVGVFGQAPSWAWAKSGGGNGTDSGLSIAVDDSGNVYSTGTFDSDTITFGTITLFNADTIGYSNDMFVVKYDSNGNVLWAYSFGGIAYEDAYSITLDKNGGIYVAGYFTSSSVTFGSTSLTNCGGDNMFLVKFDTNGNVLWARSANGCANVKIYCTITDNSGNVFVPGYTSDDSITFGSITLHRGVDEGLFLVKYDTNGNVLWAKFMGGMGHNSSITSDTSGNIYVAGDFSRPSITIGTTTLYNADTTGYSTDLFLAKYDSNGNEIWAKSAAGNKNDYVYGITTDGIGNVYLTGYFYSSVINFGLISLLNSNFNFVKMFIVKYDSSGNVAWANEAVGNSWSSGSCVVTDSSNNVFVSGNFGSPTVTFGTITLNNSTTSDMFIVKYNTNGNAMSALGIGGCASYGIAIDKNENLYVTGLFEFSTTFGSTTLSCNDWDMFIAKQSGIITSNLGFIDDNNLIIFPNPTTSQINIISSFIIDKITITDVMGRMVYEALPKQKDFRVEMDNKEGIYFITLSTDKERVVRKVVVQK